MCTYAYNSLHKFQPKELQESIKSPGIEKEEPKEEQITCPPQTFMTPQPTQVPPRNTADKSETSKTLILNVNANEFIPKAKLAQQKCKETLTGPQGQQFQRQQSQTPKQGNKGPAASRNELSMDILGDDLPSDSSTTPWNKYKLYLYKDRNKDRLSQSVKVDYSDTHILIRNHPQFPEESSLPKETVPLSNTEDVFNRSTPKKEQGNPKKSCNGASKQDEPAPGLSSYEDVPKYDKPPPSLEHLKTKDTIIFWDLDNYHRFPNRLSKKIFVWAFIGGKSCWKKPYDDRQFYSEHCGKYKNAADFAICYEIGVMNTCLPQNVKFILVSGDKGFKEIERKMKSSNRKFVLVDPHQEKDVYTVINSISKEIARNPM